MVKGDVRKACAEREATAVPVDDAFYHCGAYGLAICRIASRPSFVPGVPVGAFAAFHGYVPARARSRTRASSSTRTSRAS